MFSLEMVLRQSTASIPALDRTMEYLATYKSKRPNSIIQLQRQARSCSCELRWGYFRFTGRHVFTRPHPLNPPHPTPRRLPMNTLLLSHGSQEKQSQAARTALPGVALWVLWEHWAAARYPTPRPAGAVYIIMIIIIITNNINIIIIN
ncbi:hypothetical protein U0070_020798 [Myodes glareolus]|uniref:Uncharacterized protein n=1 Tax=Myodes glareolus TaxID=447135 RepID=A0AAW0IEE8_MYOGA